MIPGPREIAQSSQFQMVGLAQFRSAFHAHATEVGAPKRSTHLHGLNPRKSAPSARDEQAPHKLKRRPERSFSTNPAIIGPEPSSRLDVLRVGWGVAAPDRSFSFANAFPPRDLNFPRNRQERTDDGSTACHACDPIPPPSRYWCRRGATTSPSLSATYLSTACFAFRLERNRATARECNLPATPTALSRSRPARARVVRLVSPPSPRNFRSAPQSRSQLVPLLWPRACRALHRLRGRVAPPCRRDHRLRWAKLDRSFRQRRRRRAYARPFTRRRRVPSKLARRMGELVGRNSGNLLRQ
jgi:hypothetical protein